jgi:quinol monooxygenase YgiN
MKRHFAVTLIFAVCFSFGCGTPPAPNPEPTNTIDEPKCSRELLEPDSLTSAAPIALDTGTYVVSSTYVRIKNTKEAGEQFQRLVDSMGEALQSNPGLIQVVTRLSVECNSARTLSVWRDEAAMFEFVGSPAHANAMSQVKDLSRGGGAGTHWTDDGSGFNWETALAKLKEETGSSY